jgi:4-alpha-glucanotransferase
MKATNYAWWRQRLTHMSHYFDATRIDHVLGFFRIWSVPMHAIEGVFGVFVPAIGFTKADFEKSGLQFDEIRFCNPYINDDMLQNMFGDKASDVKLQFMNGNAFKEELNTQRKIEFFSKSNNIDPLVKQKLFDLLGEVILFKDDKNNEKYHFRIDIHDTISFKELSHNEQEKLNRLYVQYFYEKQNDLWYRVAQEKLDAIQQSSDMMICAEDLGMVPEMVEDGLKSREMLALQVQRMPKKSYQQFSHPNDAPYLSVVTPSTHDMSTIRQWWEEDVHLTQRFYNDLLLHTGKAPQFCEPEICKEIIHQHLKSPAMWSVFLLQDLMSVDGGIRRVNPDEERINIPADPNHYWNYRMHITLESLKEQTTFNEAILHMIKYTQRC